MKLEQAARQALVALEDVMADFDGSWALADTAITALREALAEPKRYNHETGSVLIPNPLAEQAEQEQVCIDWDTKTDEPIMGYAAPVRTKDLTDDEIYIAVGSAGFGASLIAGCRAVIAADRRINETFPNPPTV